jgi:hypothetical protein
MADAPPPNRTQIPNIVDDLGLDPYERALYVHYKRVCGENQGAYCYEATRTTAGKVKMSTGQVSSARKSLTERGLIIVQAETRPVVVTIVNIWEINTAFYKLEYRPDVDTWTIEQVQVWLYDMSTDVHTVNVSSHNDSDIRSPDERNLTEYVPDVHCVNIGDNMSSDVHTVKQRIDVVHDKASPTFKTLYNRWLDNLGKLAPRQVELFGDYYDEHPDWVAEIIDTTIGGKPDNPWQYFVKIINSWVKNGKPAEALPRSNSPPAAQKNGAYSSSTDQNRLRELQEESRGR